MKTNKQLTLPHFHSLVFLVKGHFWAPDLVALVESWKTHSWDNKSLPACSQGRNLPFSRCCSQDEPGVMVWEQEDWASVTITMTPHERCEVVCTASSKVHLLFLNQELEDLGKQTQDMGTHSRGNSDRGRGHLRGPGMKGSNSGARVSQRAQVTESKGIFRSRPPWGLRNKVWASFLLLPP